MGTEKDIGDLDKGKSTEVEGKKDGKAKLVEETGNNCWTVLAKLFVAANSPRGKAIKIIESITGQPLEEKK